MLKKVIINGKTVFTNAISSATHSEPLRGKKITGGLNFRSKDKNPMPSELKLDEIQNSRYDLAHPTMNPYNGLLRFHYPVIDHKARI